LRNAGNYWCKYKGLCLNNACRRFLQAKGGIFCANFSERQGDFAPCNSCWCGPCYTPLGVRNHPIWRQVDKDGEFLEDEDEYERFQIARPGDHLMVPFQCELCHFRNIMKRNPTVRVPEDQELLDFMRRANLDAFWSQEKSSVFSNLKEAMRVKRTAFRLRMPSITPPMGPFPLED
jgi:hypothetical protein